MEKLIAILYAIGFMLFFGGIAVASFIMANAKRFDDMPFEDNNEEYH